LYSVNTKKTKFTLLFYNTEYNISGNRINKEWHLATVDKLNAINVDVQGGTAIKLNGSQGISPVFEITPAADLQKHQSIDVTVNNIITDYPSGFANIYLKYKNVPGYWDGQFVLPVEKTPIVQGANKKVGIGVLPEEGHRLTVGGNLKINGDLSVTGKVTFPNKNSLPLQYVPCEGEHDAASFIFGDRKGWKLHFGNDHDNKPYSLTIVDNGRVGINNKDPQCALDVNGDSNISGNLTVGGAIKLGDGGTIELGKGGTIKLGENGRIELGDWTIYIGTINSTIKETENSLCFGYPELGCYYINPTKEFKRSYINFKSK